MAEGKTIILNGTKLWCTLIVFVIVHGGTGIWWAATVNNRVAQLEKQQVKIEKTIEKQDTKLDTILAALATQQAFSRSA